MSHTEDDDALGKGVPEENTPKETSDDPFGKLGEFAEDDNENTIQRLSHLVPDEHAAEENENTVQRLSRLMSDNTSDNDANEGTSTRLGKLIITDDEPAQDEDTVARLGSLMEDFADADEEEEVSGMPEEAETAPSVTSAAEKPADLGLMDGSGADDVLSPFNDGGEFGESSEFSADGGLSDLLSEDGLDVESAPNAKAVPAKKTKKPKKVKPRARGAKKEKAKKTGVDWLIASLWIVFILLIAAGNVWAFMAQGIERGFFVVPFNILGLILLLIPYLLAVKKRREGVLNLYDTMLGIALAALIFGCMMLLSVQARYGTHIKGNASISVTECRDVY